MRKYLLTVLLALFALSTSAQRLVMIPIDGETQAKSLYADSDLSIHYYCHDFVLATTQEVDPASMIMIDDDAFADGPYFLVRCPLASQTDYLSKENAHGTLLYRNDDVLVFKSVSSDFQPFENDGMVTVTQSKIRLGNDRHDFPIVTGEDMDIRRLLIKVNEDNIVGTIRHLQHYNSRRWDNDTVYMAQDWLKGQYEAMGLDVSLHDIDSFWENNIVTSDNVIAIQRGEVYPDEYVVCGAHYDSYSHIGKAPGADDNASGTAGILETARILSQYRFERSIIYCGWAAEERGLLGSEAYASMAQDAGMDIVAYFNLDMTGYLADSLDFCLSLIYIPFSDSLAAFYRSVCNAYYPNMRVVQSWFPNGSDSDHSSFHRHGYPSVMPFEQYGHTSPYIHSLSDTLGLSVNNTFQSYRFTEMNLANVAILAGYIGGHSVGEFSGDLSVYPNPANSSVTISGNALTKVDAFDMLGQKVFSTIVTSDQVTVQTDNWQSGIYILQVTFADGSIHTHKIQIIH